MLQKGQKVRQKFGGPIMTVTDFESELIENTITTWTDETGAVLTGKFMESQLIVIK